MFLPLREPARLVNSNATDDFTLRLLRSADADQPPTRSVNRAMVHVTALLADELNARSGQGPMTAYPGSGQVAGRIGGVRHSGPHRGSHAPLRITRAAGFGLLLGTSLAAAVVGVTQTAPPQERTMIAQPVSSAPSKPSTRSVARVRIPAAVPASEAPPPSATSSNQSRDAKPAKPSGNQLGQEVALLDAAKTALSEADPRRAIRALDEAAKLSRRVLVPEATVLRVRALVALKHTTEAQRVVARFVDQSPYSPVNPILRDLIHPVEKP